MAEVTKPHKDLVSPSISHKSKQKLALKHHLLENKERLLLINLLDS